jgi:hypothetical protein
LAPSSRHPYRTSSVDALQTKQPPWLL